MHNLDPVVSSLVMSLQTKEETIAVTEIVQRAIDDGLNPDSAVRSERAESTRESAVEPRKRIERPEADDKQDEDGVEEARIDYLSEKVKV